VSVRWFLDALGWAVGGLGSEWFGMLWVVVVFGGGAKIAVGWVSKGLGGGEDGFGLGKGLVWRKCLWAGLGKGLGMAKMALSRGFEKGLGLARMASGRASKGFGVARWLRAGFGKGVG